MMTIQTANIIIYCEKWKESTQFYSYNLSLPTLFQKDWFVEFKLTESARLSLADATRSSIKSSHGMGLTISLQVDDIESEHIRFQKKNLKPTPIRSVWDNQVFYLFDPEGNRIEFWA